MEREKSSPVKLHFGCGQNFLGGWENHDIEVDISKPLPYGDNSADFVYTEHVIEHLMVAGAWNFFEESYRILKPAGVFRAVFPCITSLGELDEHYHLFWKERGWGNGTREGVIKALALDFGHQSLWTPDLMKVCLNAVGFYARETGVGESFYYDLRGIEKKDVNRETDSVAVEAYKPDSTAIQAHK